MGICNFSASVHRTIRRRPHDLRDEATDAAEFARTRLGFKPDERQSWVLGGRRRRLLLNCSRQWGKSTVTAIRAVYEAATRPGSLTVVAGPSARQSGELVRKAAELARRMGERARGDGQNELSVRFSNGSRIVGIPGREATVRGFSAASLVVLDEAARAPDGLYKALRPMLAVAEGDLWLLSTPWGKRGFFYEAWANGDAEWDRVAAPATECKRIRPEFLAEERRELGEEWFRQEYLCEFVDVDAGMFGRDVVLAALGDDVEPLSL